MKTSTIITAADLAAVAATPILPNGGGVVPGWPVRAGLPAATAHQRSTVMTATRMSDEALDVAMADLSIDDIQFTLKCLPLLGHSQSPLGASLVLQHVAAVGGMLW